MNASPGLPDYVSDLVDQIRTAGFNASAYVIHSHDQIRKTFIPRCVIQVQVDRSDNRFKINSYAVVTTPICAQTGPSEVGVTSPAGFFFNCKESGSFVVSASSVLEDEGGMKGLLDLAEFAHCFTHPWHEDGKIRGPMSMPGEKRQQIRDVLDEQRQSQPLSKPSMSRL